MSKLVYNGVEFSNVLTQSIGVEPVRDATDSEYLYTRYTIRVQAILTRSATPPPDDEHQVVTAPPMIEDPDPDVPAGVVENISAAVPRIEAKLRTPRRALRYTNDDGTMIEVAGSPDQLATDLANGPLPQLLTIRDVTQDTVFVDFVVSACVRAECSDAPFRSADGAQVGPYWLSHRWGEVTEILPDWRTRRTRTGTVVLPTGVDPELMRAAVTPQVPAGFRRAPVRYEVTNSGLAVNYHFTDEEVMRPPPVPLLRLYGQQEMSTPNYGGAVKNGSIRLRGVGAKGVSKAVMFAALVRIAMSRAFAAGAVKTKTGTIISKGVIGESLDDDKNEVWLSFDWRNAVGSQRHNPTALAAKLAGNTAAGTEVEGVSLSAGGLFLGAVTGVVGNILGVPVGVATSFLNGSNPADAVPAPQANEQGLDRAGLPVTLDWLGLPLPGSTPSRGIAPPTRGTADAVKLAAAVLNDPCGKTAALKTLPNSNRLVGTASGGASVEVAEAVYPDDYAGLYGGDDSPGVYDHFTCTSSYTDDPGVRVLPTTKPGEPCVKVRVMNATRRLRCEWHVKRTGGPPVLPDVQAAAQAGTENWVFVGGTTSLNEMNVAGDGVTPIYEAAGVYEFAALDPAATLLAAPVAPFLGAVSESSFNNAPMLGLAGKAADLRGKSILFPVETTAPPIPPPPTSPPPGSPPPISPPSP